MTGAFVFPDTNTAIGLSDRDEARGQAQTSFTKRNYSRSINFHLRNITDLVAAIRKEQPDLTMHSAAIAKLTMAAKDPNQAYAVIVTVSRILAEEAEALGSTMILISTDALFSN